MTTISILPYVIISILSTVYVSPYQYDGQFSTAALIAKVVPVLYLVYYLNSYLNATSQKTSAAGAKRQKNEFYALRRHLASNVNVGFICSVVGDGFLFFYKQESYLLLGMAAFAMAHMCYIRGYGFHVIRASVAWCMYGIAMVAALIIVRGAPYLLQLTIPLYAILFATMIWRAIDRAAFDDGRPGWKKLILPLGAATFLISDLCLGLFKFVITDMHYTGEYIVMATYFTGQGLIAIGVS